MAEGGGGVVASFLAHFGFKVDSEPLSKMEHQLEKVHEKLEFLAAAEVLHGIFEAAEKFGSWAEHLGVAATAAGLTAEELQKLQFAAGLSGVSADDVSTAMSHLTRTLYDAKNGGAEAAKAFADAGISAGQVAGFKTSEQALKAFADRVAATEDPIKRQAMTLKLLGRGAGNMVEMLSGGSAAINKFGNEAEALGAVVSDGAIEALRETEDTVSTLFKTLYAFAATVASYFAPAITYLTKEFLRFFGSGQKVLKQNFRVWAYDITYALGYLWGWIKTLGDAFLDFVKGHPELVKWGGRIAFAMANIGLVMGFVGAAASIATTGLGFIKGGFLALLKPLRWALTFVGWVGQAFIWMGTVAVPAIAEAFMALGAALGINPITWMIFGIVGAIAALVLAGQALYAMFFQHKDFKDTWLGSIWSALKSGVGWLGDKLGVTAPQDGSAAASSPASAANLGTIAGEPNGFAQKAAALFGMPDALGGAAALGSPAALLPNPAAGAKDAADMGAAAGGDTWNIQAPISITVPNGTDTAAVAGRVKDSLAEQFAKLSRETRRGLRTSQAY